MDLISLFLLSNLNLKNMKMLVKILSLAAFFSLLVSCQKEDQMTLNTNTETEFNSVQLKSGSISDNLSSLIGVIENMVNTGILSEGNGNSLILKVENAIKSIDKKNTNAVIGQLNAFINEVKDFVDDGIFTINQGQPLINNVGIILTIGSVTDLRDKNEYSVKFFGTHIWMTENLAYLPAVSPPGIGSDIDPVYYVYDYQGSVVDIAKASDNYKTYGVLYNWPAAKTVCPIGWRLPATNYAWSILCDYLISNGYNYDGTTIDNKIAKSMASLTNWEPSGVVGSPGNDPASNNRSGFSGQPGGSRAIDGTFTPPGMNGFWWSSTPYSGTNVYRWYINWNSVRLLNDNARMSRGFSVRCIINY
jgi:uncharacterized protein (TIGR02145 family)